MRATVYAIELNCGTVELAGHRPSIDEYLDPVTGLQFGLEAIGSKGLENVLARQSVSRLRDVFRVEVEERLLVPVNHRERDLFGDLADLIAFGASPRATLFLARAAKGLALVRGRGYVIPEDVKEIAPDVLRHRIVATYEAEAEEITTDDVVARLLDRVEVP